MNDDTTKPDDSTPPNLDKNEPTPNYYTGGVPNPQPHYGNPPSQGHGYPSQTGFPQNPQGNNPYVNQPSQYQNPYQQPNPYQGQNPYPQPQQPLYAANYGAVPVAEKPTTSAVVAFVAGLINLMLLWIIPFLNVVTSIVGIVFSHKAMKETTPPNPTGGRGLGIAGMICNYCALLLSLGWCLFFVVLIIAGAGAEASGY